MPTSPVFEYVCEQVERLTAFNRLEARGTVRIALSVAGLDPDTVTPAQMGVVIARTLPHELNMRGIADVAALCRTIATGLAGIQSGPARSSADDVFRRLGG